MSIENPGKPIILFFKGVIFIQTILLWMPMKIIGMYNRTKGKLLRKRDKIPNYMKIDPFPGSERVLTECVRNDTMMTFRFYSPKTDMEAIINFKKMGAAKDDLNLPLEITMSTHVNGELQYVHFSGVAVPIARWDEKEFDKVRKLSQNGPSPECPEIQVSVKTLTSEEADRLLGRTHDRIDPGSKVIN